MYNFVFYKVYQQVVKSRYWGGSELWGACIIMFPIVFLNICSIYFLLLGIFGKEGVQLNSVYVKVVSLILIIGALYYYYSKVVSIDKLNRKFEHRKGIFRLPGWIVFMIFFLLSSAVAMLTAMFMNKDGVFG